MNLKTLKKILPQENIYIVISFEGEKIIKKFGAKYQYVWQKKQNGTAHAAWLAIKKLPKKCEQVIIFNGDDSLFLKSETIKKGLQAHLKHAKFFTLTYCSFHKNFAPALGGLKRDKSGRVVGWYHNNTEAKKAGCQSIETIGGFYIFNKNWFLQNYAKIKPNNKGELPLTTGYLALALKI